MHPAQNIIPHLEDVTVVTNEVKCLVRAIEDVKNSEPQVLGFWQRAGTARGSNWRQRWNIVLS